MLTYQLHQVFVGRCKYPDIHGKDPVAARRMTLRSCRTRSSLLWRDIGISPYLIQKNSPIMGQLKESHLSAAPGPGKCAVIIPKKLTLQNSLG